MIEDDDASDIDRTRLARVVKIITVVMSGRTWLNRCAFGLACGQIACTDTYTYMQSRTFTHERARMCAYSERREGEGRVGKEGRKGGGGLDDD